MSLSVLEDREGFILIFVFLLRILLSSLNHIFLIFVNICLFTNSTTFKQFKTKQLKQQRAFPKNVFYRSLLWESISYAFILTTRGYVLFPEHCCVGLNID